MQKGGSGKPGPPFCCLQIFAQDQVVRRIACAFISTNGTAVLRQHADHHHCMAAGFRPGFGGGDQRLAMAAAPRSRFDIKLAQKAMGALGLQHVHLARFVMRQGPAYGHAIVFGDQDDAGLGAFAYHGPMIGQIGGIEAAIGFDIGFVGLQRQDETPDRRFVARKFCGPNANGRAP